MKYIQKKWRGVVTDRLGSLKTRYSHYYSSEREAHFVAEQLCKKTMKERGTISVESKDFVYILKGK